MQTRHGVAVGNPVPGDGTPRPLPRSGVWGAVTALLAIVAARGAGPATDEARERVQVVNVIVVNLDPVLKTRENRKLHAYLNGSDPWQLTDAMVTDAREASGGYVEYRIVEKIEHDGFPTFCDGFTYTEQEYLRVWEQDRDAAHPGMTSFRRLFERFDLARKIQARDVREIWLWGAPYMAWDELHWKIPGDRIPYPTDNPWHNYDEALRRQPPPGATFRKAEHARYTE